ncbi:relaxase/mobilization nuclease domain-containing protein, partial [Ligilactobacillus acidipiscis]|uniref:relaxase/mobilization nuclease domain-containing protein n=1 Tax=Ligilactobacillus acidipiscis TaxID=89059 RepID=UPI000249272B
MATIKINSTGNMNSALDYAGNEKRDMKNDTRAWLRQNGVKEQAINAINGRVVHKAGANGLNIFESAKPELATSLREVKSHFKNERQFFHQTAKKQQAERIKQNFSRDELDPLNPDDWQKANDLGVELMERAYPDYQAAVYTHLDSQQHQLHNHIIMSKISSVTGKKFHDAHVGDSAEHFKDINDEISREQGWNVLQRNKLVSTRKVQHDLAQKGIPSYITDVQEQ